MKISPHMGLDRNNFESGVRSDLNLVGEKKGEITPCLRLIHL
jgi:hypothetical protein